MAKLKKINWLQVDEEMEKAIITNVSDRTIHPRIRKAMKDFPPWRFYTDSELGVCVFRVLGVYPPPDLELNPEFEIRLIAASLPAGRSFDIRMDLLPMDYFKKIDEWSPQHVTMIQNHRHGDYFAKPTGFYEICKNMNQLCQETYGTNSEEEKTS